MSSSQQQTPSKKKTSPKVFKPPANTTASPSPRKVDVTFLTLPVEIRLRIYDLLLVCRFGGPKQSRAGGHWTVGDVYQKIVLIYSDTEAPKYPTMGPSILRTCGQIYSEAINILYSQNVFEFGEPERMFRFIKQIGPVNEDSSPHFVANTSLYIG